MTETMKQRYHRLKAEGRCVQCGTPTEESIYCSKCKKTRAKSQKKRYDKHKEEHRCVSCGKVLERDYAGVRCRVCAEKNSARCKRCRRNEKIKVLENIKNALSKRS
ncbi:MAG: hypothetical protein IJ583_15230 [Firmicutes bacterium]|nr:hypothetical protein [Bacillota bacterium]